MFIIHAVLHKWTPRVLRRLQREWPAFRSKFTDDIYATAKVEDTNWRKFVELFGFKPLIEVLTVSDGPRLMYIHRTNDGQLISTNTINHEHLAVVGAGTVFGAGLRSGERRPGAGAS